MTWPKRLVHSAAVMLMGAAALAVPTSSAAAKPPAAAKPEVATAAAAISCETLPADFISYRSPGRADRLPAAGQCFTFGQPTSSRIQIQIEVTGSTADVVGEVFNAAGSRICQVRDTAACALTGSAPYRLTFTEQHGQVTNYSFRLQPIARPSGCSPLQVAAFGTPSDTALGAGDIRAPDGSSCHAFTSSAGPHLVKRGIYDVYYVVVLDADGVPVCTEEENCILPVAGNYYLVLGAWDADRSVSYEVAVYNLVSDRGCAPAASLRWDQPTILIRRLSGTQVHCQPFTATTGERIATYHHVLTPYSPYSPSGWIMDATGKRACAGADGFEDEDDGCLLTGTAPYRFLSYLSVDSRDDTYGLQIRSRSNPVGCPVVSPGSFGGPPASGSGEIRCRLLSVPAAGRYHVQTLRDDEEQSLGFVYRPDGRKLCSLRDQWCDLPAAGSYLLVLATGGSIKSVIDNDRTYSTVLLAVNAPGCRPAADTDFTGGARHGDLASIGQYDCYQISGPTAPRFGIFAPTDAAASPALEVQDATGAVLCNNLSYLDGCYLDPTGTTPFRAVLTSPGTTPIGGYDLQFVRLDTLRGCPALPQDKLGDGAGATLTFTGDRFAQCLSIAAAAHAAEEVVEFERTAGTGSGRLWLVDADGAEAACRTDAGESGRFSCPMTAGYAYNLILEAAKQPATYRVTRRDAAPPTAGCQTITPTVIGRAAVTGTLGSRIDVRCYQLKGVSAKDKFWIGGRTADGSARWSLDSGPCNASAEPCWATGETTYTIRLWTQTGGTPVPFKLDAWKIVTSGTPAECTKVPSPAFSFGPYSGVLTDDQPVRCLSLSADNGYDYYHPHLTNPEGGAAVPVLDTVTKDGIEPCAPPSGTCKVYGFGTDRAFMMLTQGNRLGRTPYRVEVDCDHSPCGDSYTLDSISPTSAVVGTRQTVALRGHSFHLDDSITLRTRTGNQILATGTVRTVSADRTVLTVDFDFTGIAAGTYEINPLSVAGVGDFGQPFTLGLAPPAVTRAPTVNAAQVGVTAKVTTGTWTPPPTSYAYQWSANGAAISGATASSYAVPAGLRGKKLTVVVTAKLPGHLAGTVTVSAGIVKAGAAPKATKAPTITGTPKKGKTVKVSAGTWSPKATSYTYQWLLNGKAVSGATKASLTLTKSMVGKKLSVVVTAKRTGHTDGHATSKAVKVTS